MEEKVKQELERVSKSFILTDHNLYLDGIISRSDLLKKYNCTEYILEKVFDKLNLMTRQCYIRTEFKENIFDTINSEESAYLLGFYLADGYISNKRFTISLSISDIDHLNLVKSLISPNSKTTVTKENVNKQGIKTNGVCSFSVRSCHLCSVLENYNLGTNKTYLNKSIRNIVPETYMWHFIRGYFDGDGCISFSNVKKTVKKKEYNYKNACWNIISHDKLILKELKSFIDKDLGKEINLYSDTKGNYLIGTNSKKIIPIIYNKLYNNATIFMNRKYNKFKDIIANTEVSSEIAKGSETP